MTYNTNVNWNPDPITQNISNGTDIEISVPGISIIGIGDSTSYIDVTFGSFSFYEGNVLDRNSSGLYFDAFNGAKCNHDSSKYSLD
jgi:hypothetical protein